MTLRCLKIEIWFLGKELKNLNKKCNDKRTCIYSIFEKNCPAHGCQTFLYILSIYFLYAQDDFNFVQFTLIQISFRF